MINDCCIKALVNDLKDKFGDLTERERGIIKEALEVFIKKITEY